MERIGKYQLEEFLGGGMSHVYRARDTVIGRTVAVKVLTEAGCQDPEIRERFLTEARLAGNISHDHVLHIYDFGEDEKQRPFLVMEFLRGEDLRHAMREGRTGDLKNRLRIALDVARALEYIHTLKIIHRDIKPENIHISDAGIVKLMDFGIAKGEGASHTRTGYVLGTPYYMAPEQVTGQGITAQVDVYAFGVLLFELLTGARPIAGDTVERIFYAILNEPLNLTPLREAGVPEPLCSLVERATAKKPGDRPQGMTAVCLELERAQAESDMPAGPLVSMLGPAVTLPLATAPPAAAATVPPPAPNAVTAPPGRRPWLLPAILLGLIAAAGGAWIALRPHPITTVTHSPVKTSLTRPDNSVAPAPAGMVTVSGGSFLLGPNRELANLPPFYIDRTEVSNAAYQAFCGATQHPLPEAFPASSPDLPVVNVTIRDAEAFAQWAGKRLPTAREWEKAARGADGRLFPWGNQADAARANVKSAGVRPVEGFADGASPYGALQMVGNVWEWVEEATFPTPHALAYFRGLLRPAPTAAEPWYQLRGLSFNEPLVDNAVWDFSPAPARWKDKNIGFRCARDAR